LIKNNNIQNNSAEIVGGFDIDESNPDIINNLIYNNSSNTFGGAVRYYGSNGSIINNTFLNNEAGTYGGAIYFRIDSDPIIYNTIFRDNSSSSGGDQIYLLDTFADPDFYYCNIEGGNDGFEGPGSGVEYTGIYQNNIDVDPNFLGTGDYPYQLSDMSFCANAGTPDTTGLNLPEFDLAGNPRIFNDRIDIGAYEYQGTEYQPDFVWAKSAGSASEDFVEFSCTDANGNTYITGSFQDTISFGSYTLISEGLFDIFVAKINSDGEYQWATKAGGTDNHGSTGIGIDAFAMKWN